MSTQEIIEEVLESEVEMGIISTEEFAKERAWLRFAQSLVSK